MKLLQITLRDIIFYSLQTYAININIESTFGSLVTSNIDKDVGQHKLM